MRRLFYILIFTLFSTGIFAQSVYPGQHNEVRFKPLYQIRRERYIVYWNLNKNTEIKQIK
jgi:hypothetical protein